MNNNENQYNRKLAEQQVMELHIRRVSTPDKAPLVMSRIFVMASNDLVFQSLEEAETYCKNWSTFLTNKLHRSISCSARYKHPHSQHMFRTVSYKRKYYAALQN